MRVLMLGWEYPPHMSGGLGTACEGLTRALSAAGTSIDFVVPKCFGDEQATHMRLFDASRSIPRDRDARGDALDPLETSTQEEGETESEPRTPPPGLRTIAVPSPLTPYLTPQLYAQLHAVWASLESAPPLENAPPGASLRDARSPTPRANAAEQEMPATQPVVHYGGDLFEEVARFSAATARTVSEGEYDLVHAHDWMTYPAAIALSQRLEVPLVVHVHSIERDRAGAGENPTIAHLEQLGMERASVIVAVSHYTRAQIHERYGIPLSRIEVVHNGVYQPAAVNAYRRARKSSGPVVLFLGRVTFQKGPDYFVEAASLVLRQIPDAVFVMAGVGDMLPGIVARVRELGIESSFRFPGFLRGRDVERAFATADVYVMPSVSEPFGISALEAMSHDRPVIVSRQSGVSEVLRHVLKVDFWDVERLAARIVDVLRYPQLRESMVAMAREEVRRLHWDAAASKLIPIYQKLAS